MDKFKFWVIFMSIVIFGTIIVSGILGYPWVNSPTTWSIEIGFDDESLEVMDRALELSDSINNVVEVVDEYNENFEGMLDEI